MVFGSRCECQRKATGKEGPIRDRDHLSTCSQSGRSRPHTAVLKCLEKAVKVMPGKGTTWVSTEPRGDRFYNSPDKLKGPDAIVRGRGGETVLDVTGITTETRTAANSFGANGTRGIANTNLQSSVARPTRPRSQLTPLQIREAKKKASKDAEHAAKHGVRYAVGAFGTNGGVSQEFNCLLTEWFTGYDKPFVGNDTAVTTHLQHVQQSVRATIINAQAEVIQSNMLYAYRSMGYDDEEVAWMRETNRVEDAEPMLMAEAPPMPENFEMDGSDDDEEDSEDEERGAAAVIGAVRPAAARGWPAAARGWTTVGSSGGGGRRGDGRASAAGGRYLGGGAAAAAGGSNRRVIPAGPRGGRGAAASRGQGHAGRARGGSAVGPRGGGRAAGQRRYGGMCIGEKKEPRSGKEKAAARE
jgi:hypothetical protein